MEYGRYIDFFKEFPFGGMMYADGDGNLSTYSNKRTPIDDDIIFEWLEVYLYIFKLNDIIIYFFVFYVLL